MERKARKRTSRNYDDRHITKGVLAAYRDDQLDDALSHRVREHIVSCVLCRHEYCRIAHLA